MREVGLRLSGISSEDSRNHRELIARAGWIGGSGIDGGDGGTLEYRTFVQLLHSPTVPVHAHVAALLGRRHMANLWEVHPLLEAAWKRGHEVRIVADDDVGPTLPDVEAYARRVVALGFFDP